jgi:hypothetical protein
MPSRRAFLAVADGSLAGCVGGDAPATRTDADPADPSRTPTPLPGDGSPTASPGTRGTPTPARDPLGSVGGDWPQFADDGVYTVGSTS